MIVTFADSPYELHQPFAPAGDQPEAIDRLTEGLEDGLSFATNPNNLQLALKGMSATDDFRPAEAAGFTAKRPASTRTFPAAPARPAGTSSMLDLIE